MVAETGRLQNALEALEKALSGLESAVDARTEKLQNREDLENEVRIVHEDRAGLARELDQAQFRANRLEEVNREVSRRLVTAMETIRSVLDHER
ncbi:DUF4164 domain-containing protein [Martelella sp. AD-3]|uniref:DUF4164 domain-containing protein n=1 Tax=Martelella sp. AD-3 TaxID=686597 RepID=UPI000463CC30|nr:DUF4164 domain-containing protein [Martelella sp. AD-3]AMM85450.1 hypothetical protein AZF01_14675 [Martelella sp. AD-3]MAM13736.1 DUF4164 domain-containing protein [Rhizobiaceae bacterium]|tara:strand:- start:230 stop:511 length:282 start_codon:yes stop_codon:yes gene_type:complete